MSWCTIGVDFEDDKRQQPSLWVTIRTGSTVLCLSPLQAREMAIMLKKAADHVERVKKGVCVTVKKSTK